MSYNKNVSIFKAISSPMTLSIPKSLEKIALNRDNSGHSHTFSGSVELKTKTGQSLNFDSTE